MDTLFNLKIRSYTKPLTEYELSDKDFFKSKLDAINNLEQPKLIVKENQFLSIELKSKTHSYFYSDLLEIIPDDKFTFGEYNKKLERIFLNNTGERYLYHIEGGYPLLIPGKFLLEVMHDGNEYYTILEIKPKIINDNQLENMRKLVEETAFFLAKDFHFNMLNTATENQQYDPNKITLLMENYSKLINNLIKIEKYPHYEIKKLYSIKKENRRLRKDYRTTRFEQKTPHKAAGYYGFKNVLNYNTIYNQNLKYFLNYIRKFIGTQIKYITELEKKLINSKKTEIRYGDQNLKTTKSLDELLKMKYKLNILYQSVNALFNTEWFESVNNKKNLKSIDRYIIKKHYAIFYEIFIQLRNNEAGEKTNYLSNFGFYWRETSRLYEIWGVLEMFKILKHSKLGFLNMKSLNEEGNEINEFGNTFILNFEGNVRLQIFFDKEILSDSKKDKVYTNANHNKPDIRIDVYKKDCYLQTIIGDFKYRNLYINEVRRNGSHDKLFNQFNDYSNIKLSQGPDNIVINKLCCMLPKEGIYQQPDGIKMTFISLTPLKDNREFGEFLEEAILSILNQ